MTATAPKTSRRGLALRTAGLVGVIVLAVLAVVVVRDAWRSIRLLGGSEATIAFSLVDAAPGESVEVSMSGAGSGSRIVEVRPEAAGAPVVVEVVLRPLEHALNSYGSALFVRATNATVGDIELECDGPVAVDGFGRIVAPPEWPQDTDIDAHCRVRRVPVS